MAGSYSADLRGRVLATVEAGATPGAAARRFAVGRSTAYRWAAEARTEGRRAAKRVGGGPKPRITGEVEAALLGLLREANHLTLAELHRLDGPALLSLAVRFGSTRLIDNEPIG